MKAKAERQSGMAKTLSQKFADLENRITALEQENAMLKQELADVKGGQRVLAAAIRDLSVPQPSFIAQVNKSRQ